jgi:hypothetical protein
MARTKKVHKFDFSGMANLHDPVNSIELTIPEMAKAAEDLIAKQLAAGEYVGSYSAGYINALKTTPNLKDNEWCVKWAKRFLFQYDHAYRAAYDAKFAAWYASHEGAQEVYKAVAPNKWWWTNLDGSSSPLHEAKEQGRFDAPASYVDFTAVIESTEGRTYIETNREQVFEVGDLVVLRTPFVGSYDYDPHYRNETMTRADKRYGTVMEEGTGDIAGRWASKGSRAISVLWFGKSEVVTMPEKVLKFESRKGRG